MSDLIERQTALRCIKESRENIDWGQSEDGDAFLHYSAALYRTIASKECMPSVQPEPHWIPCSERLPERGVSVLISHVGYVYEDYLDLADGELYFWNSGLDLDEERRNIAWMPLPQPWKGR